MLGPIFIFQHFRFTLTVFYTEVMLKKGTGNLWSQYGTHAIVLLSLLYCII